MKKCRVVAVVACLLFAEILASAPLFPVAAHAKQAQSDSQALSGANGAVARSADPLPSWSAGKARERIINFVKEVTDPSSKNFVPESERFATFDNDGTILCEKPTFFEAIYAHDRARHEQEKHPEWASDANMQKFLQADENGLAALGSSISMFAIADCNGGLNLEQLHEVNTKWLDSAKHPRFGVLYKKLYYSPMIELLNYLRANGFKVYLCSGGQTEFMRCYAAEEYGIDAANVIGSAPELEYTVNDGRSTVVAKAKVQLFNIGNNKPVTISQRIGRRPVIACGNSDGDLQMLTYAGDSKGPSLSILIHHDDGEREYLYDRGAEKVLPLAAQKGWLVVSIKDDFGKVFASDSQK